MDSGLKEFFSHDVLELKDSDVYNVVCRNKKTGEYCYGYLSPNSGKLTAGYHFGGDDEEDLHINLDKDKWQTQDKKVYLQNLTSENSEAESEESKEMKIEMSEKEVADCELNTVNVLINRHSVPFSIKSFNSVDAAEVYFCRKVREIFGSEVSEEDLNSALDDGYYDKSGDVNEIFIIHSE